MNKHRARCLCLLVWSIACFGLLGNRMTTARSGPPEQPGAQTLKNIQVLKELPEAQLFSLMNLISTSLGVTCVHCHVQNGKDPQTGFDKWDWASDDKESKRTARRMMQMVMNINQTNRPDLGVTGVTCYTCHRGSTRPVGLQPMPLTVSGHEPSPAPATAAEAPRPETPPTVQQIIDKYVAAVGGRDRVARLQTRVLKGTREASQGRTWPIEVTIKDADKMLTVASLAQGQVVQGFNGAVGWIKGPQEQHAATAEELASLKHSAELYNILQVSTPTPTMRFAGLAKVGDREAYVIRDRYPAGVSERFFFDRETGLLLRRFTLTDTILTSIPEQIDFEDYREVDGIKVPFTIRNSNIDTYFSATRKFTEIKFNVPVNDALFKMPEKQ
jgi:photosynthetic reaction center cytochrome c subunit